MIKVRLEGLPEDVKKYLEKLKKNDRALQESKPYKNRNSEYVRVYLDIDPKIK